MILMCKVVLHSGMLFSPVQENVSQGKCFVDARQSLLIFSQYHAANSSYSVPVNYIKSLFLPLKVANPNK